MYKETSRVPELQEVEQNLWTPDTSIRGHHFFGFGVPKALLGNYSPYAIAKHEMEAFDRRRTKDGDADGYWKDTLGKGKRNWDDVLYSKIRYYQTLQNLPSDSVIQIDRELDGICGSCPMGRHCESFNYMESGLVVGTWSDGGAIGEINKLLVAGGFQEGEDFVRQPQTRTIFNLHGRALFSPKAGTPIVQEYSALLAKTGALRAIIK